MLAPTPRALVHRLFVLLISACVIAGCDRYRPDRATTTQPNSVTTEESAPAPPEEEPVAQEEEAEPTTQQNPLLWEVRTDEHPPVYLLGTIHIGFDAKDELPQQVWDRLDKSEVFVMETDLNAASTSMLSRASMPEGETLKEKLGEKHWEMLDERLGGAAEQFKSTQPWFVVSMLIMKMMPEGVSSAPMDRALHDYARAEGKELMYLETPEQQFEVLQTALDLEELKKMLEEFEEQQADLSKMMTYYREGDAEAIERISFDDLEEDPEMYETLFFTRNEAWVPKIETYAEQGNVFVAFGAGHLFGDRGVLNLLRERGYTVERVTLHGDEASAPAETEAAAE